MAKKEAADKASGVKHFIRGGQVTHHSLAMFWQVCKFLIFISVWIIVGVGIYRFMDNTDAYQRSVARSYFYAYLQHDWSGSADGMVGFVRPDGSRVDVAARELLTHPGVRQVAGQVKSELISAFKVSALIAALLCCLVAIYFTLRGSSLARRRHLQGSLLAASPKAFMKAIRKHNRSFPKERRTPVVHIGELPLTMGDETKGIVFIGAVGVGKTVALNRLLEWIRANGDRAVVYDKMGTFVEAFYDPQKDVILNPFDNRSPSWNLFDDVLLPTDLMSIATAYMPDKSQGGDPLWIQGARILFDKVGQQALRTKDPDNKLLIDGLLKMPIDQMAKLLKGTTASSLVDAKAPKQALGFRAVLATWLDPLDRLPMDRERFSIRRWLEADDGEGFLFLPSRGDLHATMRPLITAWLEIIVNGLLTLPSSPTRRIWIITDELPSLQEIPSYEALTAETRQKGACPVAGIQNFPQMEAIYGEKRAKAISGNWRTRFIFSTGDGEVAKWCSDQIGERTVLDYRETVTYGAVDSRDSVALNEQREKELLALASDIQDLPDGHCYVRMPQGIPVGKIVIPHKSYPSGAPSFVLRYDLFKKKSLAERMEEEEEGRDGGEQVLLPNKEARSPGTGGEVQRQGDLLKDDGRPDSEPERRPDAQSLLNDMDII